MALDRNTTPTQVRNAYKLAVTDGMLVLNVTAIENELGQLNNQTRNQVFDTAYADQAVRNRARATFDQAKQGFEQAINTFNTHMATPVAKASNALTKLSVDVGMAEASQTLSSLQAALIEEDRLIVDTPAVPPVLAVAGTPAVPPVLAVAGTPAVTRTTDPHTIHVRRTLGDPAKITLLDRLAPSLTTLDPQDKLELMTAALAIDDDPEPAADTAPRKTPSKVVTDFAQQLDAEQKTRGRLVRGLKATAGKYNQALEALQDAIVTRNPNATLPGNQPPPNIAGLIGAHRETTKKIADHKQVSLEAAAKWAAELNRLDQSAEALGVDRHRNTSDKVRRDVKAAAENPAEVSKAQKKEKDKHSSWRYTVEVTLDKNGTKTYTSKSPKKLAQALQKDGHKTARITSQPGQPSISVEKARKFVKECNERGIAVDPSTIPTTNKQTATLLQRMRGKTPFADEMATNQALFDQNNYQKTQATNLPSWIQTSLSQPAQGNDAIIRRETTELADQMAREAASSERDNPFPGGLPGMGQGQ